MRVKSRSIASISKLSKSRCRGKMRGYDKRLSELGRVLLIVDSFGLLTDELLLNIFDTATLISIERLKVNHRYTFLYSGGDYSWVKDDNSSIYTPGGYIYDFSFYTHHLNSRKDIYNRFRKLNNERKNKENR